MNALRSIGAFAGGAAQGLTRGIDAKNALERGNRDQETYTSGKDAAKDVDKGLMSRLAEAHQGAQTEFGKIFSDFLAPSPMTNLTGAAATDAAAQPPGQFGGAMPNVNAQLAAPPPTPMITAMTQPRRVRPLAFSNDAATFNEE